MGGNWNGAGDGNRTRTASLEGWDSTIELHPRRATEPSVGWAAMQSGSMDGPSRTSAIGLAAVSLRHVIEPSPMRQRGEIGVFAVWRFMLNLACPLTYAGVPAGLGSASLRREDTTIVVRTVRAWRTQKKRRCP